jgi:phosphotransacetylase
MAKYVNPSNMAWNKVNKTVAKTTNKVTKGIADVVVPKTPMDVAMFAFPYGKAARMVGGIVGKGAKTVSKVYRNIGK